MFYTYHRQNSSLFPSNCFLLTAIEEPIMECEGDTCVSGTPDCASAGMVRKAGPQKKGINWSEFGFLLVYLA